MHEQVSPKTNFGDYLKMGRKIQEEEHEEERNESPYCCKRKAGQSEATTPLAVKEAAFWHATYHLAQPATWASAKTLPTALATGRENLQEQHHGIPWLCASMSPFPEHQTQNQAHQ